MSGTGPTSAGHDRRDRRDSLIRSVAGRIDSAGADGALAACDPAAASEAEELLAHHLVLPDGTDTDGEVEYLVGVLYLLRAAATETDGAADISKELGLSLTLLAPFYHRVPGMADVLPPTVRTALDGIPGFGRPAMEVTERVQAHASALNNLGMLLMRIQAAGSQPVYAQAARELLRVASDRIPPASADRAMVLCNFGYALITQEEFSEATTVLRESFEGTPPDDPNYGRCAYGLGLALLGAGVAEQDRALTSEAAGLLQVESDRGNQATPGLDELCGPDMKDAQSAIRAIMRLLGMGPGIHRDKRSQRMELAAELLDTDTGNPDQILGFLARVSKLQSQQFADLPVAEREKAQREYLSFPSEENGRREDMFLPLDPAGVAIVDELTTLCEQLLPQMAPASREHAAISWSMRYLTMLKAIRAPGVSPREQVNAMLQNLNESLGPALARFGAAADLGSLVAFSHTVSSPFEKLAQNERLAKQLRQRIGDLTPGTPEHDHARAVLAIRLFGIAGIADDEAAGEKARAIARDLTTTARRPSPALVSEWCRFEAGQLSRPSWLRPTAQEAGQSQHLLTRHASSRAARALTRHDTTDALETLEDERHGCCHIPSTPAATWTR